MSSLNSADKSGSQTAASRAAQLKKYRISESEYHKISELLGREPQGVEWAIFSALWSEHCSYKSSKVHLKKFGKTLTDSVLEAEGENAGIVDLGQNERVVFKMESHNHPSFIEPYQGAATGVGGILRDIFTMGARPIASADYLCFGEPKAERMKFIVDGVVRGISGYGNSVGVPTVTGRTTFDPSYNTNVLVNAMSIGLLTGDDPVALSGAKGPGNDVVYVGAKTGKDGVHGAAMASESFDEDSESKRPNVQIGDPFFEKLLIESCLEVIQQNLVIAIQDMGAAGLTSSSFEMAAKGGLGFDMALDLVPLRDSSIGPEEILLSESQERMLLVSEPAKFEAIQKVFSRWGLEAVRIGKVREDRKMKLTWHGETLVEIDPHTVVEAAPMYDRPFTVWNSPRKTARSVKTAPASLKETYQKRLADIQFASKSSIYRQYDQRVGGKTAWGADEEIAIQRLPVSGRGMLVAVGCRAPWMKRDARIGAMDAVFEPTLKMILRGGFPIGVTDCLNFGNPEKPEIMSEFVASVEGIRDASLALKIPVISGNVSFYNETQGQNIVSTPACGIVGLSGGVADITPSTLQDTGNRVLWMQIGDVRAEGATAFSGEFDPKKMAETFVSLKEILLMNMPESASTVGEGGWLWSLLQMASEETGFKLSSEAALLPDLKASAFEGGLYEVLIEMKPAAAKEMRSALSSIGVKLFDLGEVTNGGKVLAYDLEVAAQEFRLARQQTWQKNLEA